MRIEIDGMDELRKQLDDFAGGQAINEALAEGVNKTAEAVLAAEKQAMQSDLDRPTPFTMKALRLWKARPKKGRIDALIKMLPIQANYLQYTIMGGSIGGVVTPTRNARLNKYGNLPGLRGKGLTGIAAKSKKRFVGEINGIFGLWERYGRKARAVKLIAKAEGQGQREGRWDFYGIAERVANQRLMQDVGEAVQRAIKGAKGKWR